MRAMGSRQRREGEGPGLPPPEVRLYDPNRTGRFPTPLTTHGQVDKDALLQLVLSTIDSSYEWVPIYNVHHLNWPHRQYRQQAEAFKELPTNKILLPVEVHNWIHAITIPPRVPELEVMERYITEWQLLEALVTNGQVIIANERWARQCMEWLEWQGSHLPRSFIYAAPAAQMTMVDMLARYFMPKAPQSPGLFTATRQALDTSADSTTYIPRLAS